MPSDVESPVKQITSPYTPKSHDENRCQLCEVRACGMCSDLSSDMLADLRKITRSRDFKAGDLIFSDDQPLESYAAIKEGIVKLSKILPDGRQQTIGLGFPPDFIGRTYKDKNTYFVSAVTDVTVCTFPRDLFNAYLRKNSILEHRLFELTLNELDAAREWMLMLGQMSAIEKVATVILNFGEKMHNAKVLQGLPSEENSFELPLTRAEISEFLGLTIETVSRQFSLLKKKGLIHIRQQRYVDILHRDGLRALSGSFDD